MNGCLILNYLGDLIMYTATTNNVEINLDATNLHDAKKEAKEWAGHNVNGQRGVCIWLDGEPIANLERDGWAKI